MTTKLYFKDVDKKFRVVQVEDFDLYSLNDQKGLRNFIEKESTIRVRGAILSLVDWVEPDPKAA